MSSNSLINISLHDVSRETLALADTLMSVHEPALSAYVDRLLWWNRKVNLVSRDMSRDDVLLHVKHSLMVVSSIRSSTIDTWIDTGTGGGLPGIPLAIVLPDKHFILNDVVEKKGIALKDMVVALGLKNTSLQICDVATVVFDKPIGVVTKHAFKIGDIMSRLDKKPWQELLMLKGSDYQSELSGLDTSLIRIEAVSLEAAKPTPFFDGKYLIRICPTQSIAAPED